MGEPDAAPEPEPPVVSDGGLFGLLILDGVLLGGLGLVLTPLYAGGVPVPIGVVLSVLVLPWLVRRAGEVDARPSRAAAPLSAWVLTVAVLGLVGPGGDNMLPATWQSLLLVVGGVGAGLWALRGVLNTEHRRTGG